MYQNRVSVVWYSVSLLVQLFNVLQVEYHDPVMKCCIPLILCGVHTMQHYILTIILLVIYQTNIKILYKTKCFIFYLLTHVMLHEMYIFKI